MEYDSNLKHLSPEELAADAMKRNSLNAMGIEVITITSKQVKSTVEFERVAKQLAVCMGKRLRHDKSPGFSKAHRALRASLML